MWILLVGRKQSPERCPIIYINTIFSGYYWSDLNNRRKMFEDFARDNNFDHLVAENWYPIAGERIAEHVV
jgi:hypothetical protein